MITKIQAAEQQLDTAIRLFFENIDHLSSYTLAAASREITDDLCDKKKHELFEQEFARLGDAMEVRLSFREEMRISIKKQHLNDALRLFRSRQNFLKHADRDSDEEMDELSAHELALVILFASKSLVLLKQRVTSAISIFLHWFGAAEPRMLKERSGTHEQFFQSIERLRQTFHDLYSGEAFRVIHELLNDHY